MYAFLSAVSAFVSDRFENKNDRGASAVEYGILVALMAAAVIAAILILGPMLSELFTTVETNVGTATTTVGG
ncbi:Flp family type IVb pilin [Agrococcus sp. DT81.2]|uniref:Flp family type IVb pilin n=1 Tax=Agrococcus sp. DT81.2 TaxID=3393414 RepID=UPI003CE518A3